MNRATRLLAIAIVLAAACSKSTEPPASSSPAALSFPPPADKTPARELLHKEAPRAVVQSFIQACATHQPRLFALSISGEGISPEVAELRLDAGQGKATPALKKVMAHYAGAKSTGHAQEGDKILVTVDVGGGVIEKFTVAGTKNDWLIVDFPIPK